MQRSVVNDLDIKTLLKHALTDAINDRTLFMTGIDVSYFYEGYCEFNIPCIMGQSFPNYKVNS